MEARLAQEELTFKAAMAVVVRDCGGQEGFQPDKLVDPVAFAPQVREKMLEMQVDGEYPSNFAIPPLPFLARGVTQAIRRLGYSRRRQMVCAPAQRFVHCVWIVTREAPIFL